jgi:Mn-dependent DtxR family transcriptional regulator
MVDPRTPAISCDQLAVPPAVESPRSKLLYVTLAVTGGARSPEIQSALGISSLTLYPFIRDLQEAGIVEHADDGAVRLVDADAVAVGAR